MFIANILSRAYNDNKPVKEEHFEHENMIVDTATHMLAPSYYNKLRDATAFDEVLSTITMIIKQGTWPSRFKTAPSWLQPCYSFRDELSVEDGIVYRGEIIIIPTALRPNYIQQLHKMHQCAESTLKMTKEYFYWPKMSEYIFRHVDQCSICNSLNLINKKNR